MAGKLLKCTPGKSYECGKICLTVKKRCRLKPQGRQEEAEVATLGGLLGGTQPKALPPAKEQESDDDILTRIEKILPPKDAAKMKKHIAYRRAQFSAVQGFLDKAYDSEDKDNNPEALALRTLLEEVMRPNRTTKDPEFKKLKELETLAQMYRMKQMAGIDDKTAGPLIIGLSNILTRVVKYRAKIDAGKKVNDPETSMLDALVKFALNGRDELLFNEDARLLRNFLEGLVEERKNRQQKNRQQKNRRS